MASKQQMREKYLALRQNIEQTTKQQYDEIIKAKVLNLEVLKYFESVGIYYSKKDEVDTLKIIEHLLKLNIKVFLPRIKGKTLTFHQVTNLQEDLLLNQTFNVYEPKQNLDTISKQEIELIFVPIVCFDDNNNRIGYGKGYYDHYLFDCYAYKIGLAYSLQKTDTIASELHDVFMDQVITN